MYYSEGLDLTVLVLLAEYKLKREILKNNFKYKDVEKKKKKKSVEKNPGKIPSQNTVPSKRYFCL